MLCLWGADERAYYVDSTTRADCRVVFAFVDVICVVSNIFVFYLDDCMESVFGRYKG